MRFLTEILDALNTDGGHIVIVLTLLAIGLLCLVKWQLTEGKELFVFALVVLRQVMNSTGKAANSSNNEKGGPDGN